MQCASGQLPVYERRLESLCRCVAPQFELNAALQRKTCRRLVDCPDDLHIMGRILFRSLAQTKPVNNYIGITATRMLVPIVLGLIQ